MYGGVGGRINLALVLGAGLLIGAAPAGAADLGGDCCADLEERIAELESTAARKGNRKVSLDGGRLRSTRRCCYWDDGAESNVYQGTNDAARSRFRFNGDAKIDKEWSAGYLLEVGVRTNRLNRPISTIHAGSRHPTADRFQLAEGSIFASPPGASRARGSGRLWVGKTRPGDRAHHRDQARQHQ